MQQDPLSVESSDQPIDAFNLRLVRRETQLLTVSRNQFVYFYARFAHAALPRFYTYAGEAVLVSSVEEVATSHDRTALTPCAAMFAHCQMTQLSTSQASSNAADDCLAEVSV
jgi:hypothetical protein